MGWARHSSNWTSFSSPWARAWYSHEVVALEDGASLRDRDDRERLDAVVEGRDRAVPSCWRLTRRRAQRPRRRGARAGRIGRPETRHPFLGGGRGWSEALPGEAARSLGAFAPT